MRRFRIHHIDSFTKTMFGGNPTVTVLGADSLTDQEMSRFAREVNLSETGYILSSDKADFGLRFFTKAGDEINFCGHATVGALYSIARDGIFECKAPGKKYQVETRIGILEMEVDLTGETPKLILDAPKIDMAPSPYTHEQLAEGLGLDLGLIDRSKPVMLERTNNYLYFTARDLKGLGEMRIDMQKALAFARKDWRFVYCAMTSETFNPVHQIHARGFCPLLLIPEDPFTGSMQGGLAAYALQHGLIDPAAQWIVTEQGHFMERPGEVTLEIQHGAP
ncbi:MAG: PhzF family phenazine biosynthesis protein, partial [Parachlamydia sp.]|nr:PhzF family phenazine biosynthesis protein [Parachlamydia sp.]